MMYRALCELGGKHGMNSVFFFYTLFILGVCAVSAVLSVAAFASSRRRVFIYSAVAFSCYAMEITEIFFYEYLSQNIPFPPAEYYSIAWPLPRTILVVVLQASMWLIALDILDRTSKRVFATPVAVFAVFNAIVLLALPEGATRQWLYYTLRQAFSFFTLGYAAWCYLRSSDEQYRARLRALRLPYFIIAALTLLVLVEDTVVILLSPMNTHPDWLTLYLSERNFSENVLVCFYAVILVRYAFHVLSIRMKEAPVVEDVHDLDRHIDEQMMFFREAHGLSNRETEVLHLVLAGKSNTEIASELYLAVGTVKTHVHNILKKSGCASREELTQHFWQS